jgi:nucleoside permease NupC
LLEKYDMYIEMVLRASVIVFCVLIPILWVIQIKPLVIRKLGYYCIRNFEVKKKIEFLDLIRIILLSGKGHWVLINKPFFNSIKCGDVVEVRRSCLGGLEGIQKVRFSHQRVKKLIKKD